MLLATQHGNERGDACSPGLWQSHLTTAISQFFKHGCAIQLIIAFVEVCDDGSIETIVEASHSTGTQAETWYFLRIVVVADILLLTLELWRFLRLRADREKQGRGVIIGLGIVAHSATGLEGRFVVCEWRSQLRRVDIMQFAEGVGEGCLCQLAISDGVGADDVQRVSVVSDKTKHSVWQLRGEALVFLDSH